MRNCFLTGCYTGLLPKAPGTWGSLLGVVLAFLILLFLPQSTLFLLALLITVVAVREIDRYEAEGGIHDDPKIVIDEVAGVLFGASILPSTHPLWLLVLLVIFRILDIKKPSLISRAEGLPGGMGVMADDIVAGIVGGLVTGLLFVLFSHLP
ncbi:MAG: phosphatidylglycerophosphatase A [Epsilonproteobacteria bacterium]|nr:phosphatidylglycerophosphatase A [Campylobacterota bacterium]NPA56256.1 phosphatidylglycerophosphatase A [Campylobacterota bacterium]